MNTSGILSQQAPRSDAKPLAKSEEKPPEGNRAFAELMKQTPEESDAIADLSARPLEAGEILPEKVDHRAASFAETGVLGHRAEAGEVIEKSVPHTEAEPAQTAAPPGDLAAGNMPQTPASDVASEPPRADLKMSHGESRTAPHLQRAERHLPAISMPTRPPTAPVAPSLSHSASTVGSTPQPSAEVPFKGSASRVPAALLLWIKNGGRTNQLNVVVHALTQGLRVTARIADDQMADPSEMVDAIRVLLAEHGYQAEDIMLNGARFESNLSVRR